MSRKKSSPSRKKKPAKQSATPAAKPTAAPAATPDSTGVETPSEASPATNTEPPKAPTPQGAPQESTSPETDPSTSETSPEAVLAKATSEEAPKATSEEAPKDAPAISTPDSTASPEISAEDRASDTSEVAEVAEASLDAVDVAPASGDAESVSNNAKEQAFFDGEGVDDVAVVAEDEGAAIAALEDEPMWGETHGPVVPPEWEFVLPLAVLVISLLVMSTFWDDVRYFFSSSQPIELGSAQEGCSSTMLRKMRHNRLAHIKSLFAQPGMTAQARVRFYKQNYVVVMGCNLLLTMPTERFKQVAESYFGAKGRLIQAQRSPATRALKEYYGTSGILSFDKDTYILYVDEHPRHQWWLVMIYLLLGGLVIYNMWRLALIVWHNHIQGTEGEEAT